MYMDCTTPNMSYTIADSFWDGCYRWGITKSPPSSAIFPAIYYRDIHCDYVVRQKLGEGTWGFVRRVQKRTTEPRKANIKNYACKTILKSKLDDPILLRREVFNFDRCQQAGVPHIAKLVDLYEDLNAVHIIMEECQGQELYDEISAGGLDEEITATIIYQSLVALSFMHNVCQVCHRDIKASNFLFNDTFYGTGITEAKDVDIRLIDFGFSIHVQLPSSNDPIEETGWPSAEESEPALLTEESEPELLKQEADSKALEEVVVQDTDSKSIGDNTTATAATTAIKPTLDAVDEKLFNANGHLTSE
ncbi:MAG: hypothetical protein SGARI_007102, partial [Bacillariaceae sp.]